MATSSIKITADTSQAQSQIDSLERRLEGLEKQNQKTDRALGSLSNTARMAVGAFGALTASLGVSQIIDYTARWTDLNSRLINATGSQAAAAEALDAISASARKTYSDLETTADVFIRNSVAMTELGYTTNEQLKVSEALNNAMAISGARGQQAASALDAFAKAMASGKLQGEDLNRIMDNAQGLSKTLADALGVTSGELRRMATEGKLTSDVVIPALLSKFDELEKKATDMPATIADAFIILQNSLFITIGRMDQALGISETLAGAFVYLADNVHLVIGGLVGIGVAVLALTAKMVGLAAMTALATGGLSVVAAAGIGVALAAAADAAGLFADNAEQAVDPIKAAAKAAEDAAAASRRQADAAKKVNDEQKKALESLDKTIVKLQIEAKYQKDILDLGDNEATVRKTIREEEQKLAEVKLKLDPVRRSALDMAIRESIETRAQIQFNESIQDIKNEILVLTTKQGVEQEKILAVLNLEQSMKRALTVDEKNRLFTLIEQRNTLKLSTDEIQKQRERVRSLAAEYQGTLTPIIKDLAAANQQMTQAMGGRPMQVGQPVNPVDPKLFQEGLLASAAAYDKFQQELFRITNNTQVGIAVIEQNYSRLKADVNNAYYEAKFAGIQDLFNKEQILADLDLARTKELEELKWQATQSRIQKQLEAEKGFLTSKLSLADQEALQVAGQNERQKAIVAERISFEKKSDMEKTAFALDQAATIFNSLGAQNKKAFEAAKAFNIANAVMNTYMGATKALATYPPPFNFIAAAAVVAAGLAQVASIRSQQYSGRQLGGPVMSGTPYIVGENGPELFTPNTTGSITRNGDLGGSGTTNVNFTIVANDTADFDQLLTSRRGLITQIISDAQLERGRRA